MVNLLKLLSGKRSLLFIAAFAGGLVFFSLFLTEDSLLSVRRTFSPYKQVFAVINDEPGRREDEKLSGEIYLDDMEWVSYRGAININNDGHDSPVKLASVSYEKGITMNSGVEILLELNRQCTLLGADMAVLDDETEPGGAGVFKIIMDGDRDLYDSGIIDASIPPQRIEVNLKKADKLRVVFEQIGEGEAIGVLADAKILCGDSEVFSPVRTLAPTPTPLPSEIPLPSEEPTPSPSTSMEPSPSPDATPEPVAELQATITPEPTGELQPTTAPEPTTNSAESETEEQLITETN
jgi:hypothetical protein